MYLSFGKGFYRQLRAVIAFQAEKLKVSPSTTSKRSGINEGSLYLYRSGKLKIKTFNVLSRIVHAIGFQLKLQLGAWDADFKNYEVILSVRDDPTLKDFYMELGKIVADARGYRQLTQRDLAKLSKAGQSQINQLENGYDDRPKIETVHRLFQALHTVIVITIS